MSKKRNLEEGLSMSGKSSLSRKVIQPDGEWKRHHGDAYRCEVRLTAAPGGFVARGATLAGAEASGATEADALSAITPLLAAAVRAGKAAGKIPWLEPQEPAAGEMVRYVIVRL